MNEIVDCSTVEPWNDDRDDVNNNIHIDYNKVWQSGLNYQQK